MIALQRNKDQRITVPLLSNAHRVKEGPKRPSREPESENSPRLEMGGDVNRVGLVIWGFVLFSFVAFFFCGWLLWAKCHGH
jgi:hypothetical protein